jgi:hypothetical protein
MARLAQICQWQASDNMLGLGCARLEPLPLLLLTLKGRQQTSVKHPMMDLQGSWICGLQDVLQGRRGDRPTLAKAVSTIGG